jgi:membrane protease YdiL (CAAX protease family)
MDELTQALDAFGPWDWACLGTNLLAAFVGLFALKCWSGLPRREGPADLSTSDAILAVSTGLLSFGLIFGLVTGMAAQSFATYFGISQAHVFTAAFIGQSSAIVAMLAMGIMAPHSLHWAPAADDASAPALSVFRRTLKGFSPSHLALVLLCLLAIGAALGLAWKGVHFSWEQLAQHGLAGEAPADEPQDVVTSVLKTDVDSWRFGTIVLAVTIGAPVMEELAFRGMIYPGLQRLGQLVSTRHARWIAICLTGAIFSAAHLSPSAALPLFGFGAFMCLVRDRYGLLTCMAAHACFNGWNLLWIKLAPNAATL